MVKTIFYINKISVFIEQIYIFQNFKMISVLIIFFITISLQLDTNLPKLIKTEYQDSFLPTLNVTIGEKINIPLSNFDSLMQKGHFSFYEITKEQFNQVETKRPQQMKQKQKNNKLQEVSMDYLPFECNLRPGKAHIKSQIKSIQQQYSIFKNTVWQQNQFVHLSFKSLLYILKVSSSKLVSYLYNSASLDKITSVDIHKHVERQQYMNNLNVSPPVIALNSNQSLLYLFTSLGIWQIQTKTILTEIKLINNISGFNSKNYQGLDKVVHGQNGIMAALKRYSKVFIIPENGNSLNGNAYKQITSFHNQTSFFPQDIRLISDILYVLDATKGIYIYNIYKNGTYRQKFKIQFKSFAGNSMFQIYQNTIFINFNDQDGSKIVQINYDLSQQKAYLVRYIKSYQYITALNVMNSLTTYQGQLRQNTFKEDAFDSFLFLTLNFDDIEIYPFNVDPRIINEPFNSVKLKGNSIRKIFHIKTDYYLIITNQAVKYVRMAIQKPVIECRAKRLQQSLPSRYFKISVKSNISSCQHKNHSLKQQKDQKKFNQYCSYKTNYYVHLGDPQESYFQRVKLYSFVLGAFVLFIGGLVCLMQWRRNKMMLLRRLKDEIMRFRNRHMKMQPFSEQQVEQKDIQIEVPQFIIPPEQVDQ